MTFFVIAAGFEPATDCLEGNCSIQLSYATILVILSSGWQDSNLRPPGPKPGAMTGLRYTPKVIYNCGETGTRTQATVTRRQISNLLRYHSGTSPIFSRIEERSLYLFASANIELLFILHKYFLHFF